MKIKRCPFCLSKEVKVYGEEHSLYWVGCKSCASRGSAIYKNLEDNEKSRTMAIKAWNTRG